MYRLGIDVGGTFTDFTLLNAKTGDTRHYKSPSTPRDPSVSISGGIAAILAQAGIDGEALRFLGHGTTVATNLAIERRGARTGLITTKGFRDVLEVGRQLRPHLFDYTRRKQAPLVPRRRRHEAVERVAADGAVLTPLDEESVAVALGGLARDGVAAVAVCFLHCYQTPDHEHRVRAMIEAALPDAYISLSCEVLPEFREYERLSTTVLNAYLGPAMAVYLDGFLASVRALAPRAEPYTIHSNGGLMTPATARDFPVRTCLSGPAAGVVGAAETARSAGFADIITFDVGGTSTDVSVVHDAKPSFTAERRIAGFPVRTPMLDIHVIGAGGGSIVWMDDAGALKVGPRSAGASPGPAAYGLGGTEPTLTDANIVLGRLNAEALLQGAMPVDAAAAGDAIQRQVADPLGLSLEAAAHGIVEIAIANMSRAIRSVTTEHGHDMKDYALFAYGGAGPLHAAELAIECGIPRIVVPREPGTLCARGILLTDIIHDLVRSAIAPADSSGWERIFSLFEALRADGNARLDRDEIAPEARKFRTFIDARYVGQNYEVRVELDAIRRDGLAAFLQQFAERHSQEYGYDIKGRPVETVNCRCQAIGQVAHAHTQPDRAEGTMDDARSGVRQVYFGARQGWREAPVYRRGALPAGAAFDGPAVIEEMSATTILLPGQSATLDGQGNIVIETGA